MDNGKCICGNDISVDNEFRKELEKLLNETNPLTDNAEEITVALNHVKEVIFKDLLEFKENSRLYFTKINQNETEKEQLIIEKQKIESRLDANPIEEIKRLKRKRDYLVDENEKNISKIANRESQIERLKKQLGKERKLLNQEKSLGNEYEMLRDKVNFCKDASKAADNLYNILKEDMRLKIQKLTKEKFIKIQWKEKEFNDIIIDENYDIYIENRLGNLERPVNLSDGEKLCLGLCFMSALHNISGFDLPIIMDTPLGNWMKI